jgi:tetratricopeptide (TPR) repeat protein
VPFKSRAEFISRDELAGIVYQLMNESVKARASFDRARLLLESELRKRPEDHRVHSSLGIVYAGLERKQDAIREAKFAIKLYPVLKDTYAAPYYVENLALVYVMTGEHELALDQIEYLLSIPSFFSVPLLQLDPRWDPLRNHPRYTQVIQKYKL